MNIKDYIHHYIGCDMVTRDVFGRTAIRKLTAIVGSKAIYDCDDTEDVDMAHSWDMNYTSDPDRPLLRLLSDMTIEELDELSIRCGVHDKLGEIDTLFYDLASNRELEKIGTLYRYLLSRGFDLFGLIDAGLALDKTTYQSPQIQQP